MSCAALSHSTKPNINVVKGGAPTLAAVCGRQQEADGLKMSFRVTAERNNTVTNGKEIKAKNSWSEAEIK